MARVVIMRLTRYLLRYRDRLSHQGAQPLHERRTSAGRLHVALSQYEWCQCAQLAGSLKSLCGRQCFLWELEEIAQYCQLPSLCRPGFFKRRQATGKAEMRWQMEVKMQFPDAVASQNSNPSQSSDE